MTAMDPTRTGTRPGVEVSGPAMSDRTGRGWRATSG